MTDHMKILCDAEIVAVIGGTFIEKMHMENYVEEFIRNASGVDMESPDLTVNERLIYAKDQVVSTFKKVFPYILVGVGVGAFIHNWIPEEWIQMALGSNNPFGVILAVLVGMPMYADIFGTIPVAEALGKRLASDVFESYSAGTELKDHINQDAVRLMKQVYGIDIEQTQHNKLIDNIPEPDVLIFMGCNVSCPYVTSQYAENWGLDDPSGKSDEVFLETIRTIEEKVLQLKEKLR